MTSQRSSYFFNASRQQSQLLQPFMMRPMSTFFKEIDEQSRFRLGWENQKVPEYEMLQARWKNPLEKKKLKKAERELREANQEPVASQDAVIYVHSPENGVALPSHPENIFAIIRIGGKQTKVLNNDLLQVELLPFEIGQ